MENEKPKSFRLSPSSEKPIGFNSTKNWTRKDYGRNAIIGILGGGIAYNSGIIIIQVIGSVLSTLGFCCGIIWIYKTIKEKQSKN